ncbi:AAA family ATPase [Phreatobacter sp. AB_2022a]|uniref:AAA family ATPase n=1 Tax=Phreatobacter sp. AB_2022a TaxID=3003134 RepID=UPI002286F0A5|nr:AAA family ATPase [Phreatobacter sp. AB_2022a]MCZ0736786.1 AAA family ATPase [Phreatobacter sp. AB_2022a]
MANTRPGRQRSYDETEDAELERLWRDPQIVFSMTFDRGDGWEAEAYPFHLDAVRETGTLAFHPKVTFFVGENGSGKSTLLEALALALGFRAEGGSLQARSASYPAHSHLHRFVKLDRTRRIVKEGFFLRAESFFNFASIMDRAAAEAGPRPNPLNAYGGVSLHEQSHGESFMALMEHRFRPKGIYLLDEPEAALSPTRQLRFLRRLHELAAKGCQFVIATHAPILLAYPHARIYEFADKGPREVGYEELEHVQVTRRFLADPQRFLDTILEDE